MNDNRKIDWNKVKNYIEEILRIYCNLLSSECIEAVHHYLDHDEFEMAFEGLFLDLMKIGQIPQLIDSKECIDVAKTLKLDRESVFDADFWKKFLEFIESPIKQECFSASKRGLKNADDVIHVTPDGVALPKGTKHQIPDHYVDNPYGRPGSYGEMVDGKFQERLRIDPATPPGKKGPNYSHYHKDGKRPHYSPRPGDKDPGF